MTKKSVEDYLTEGMYGKRRPKEAERMKYLGTLRERIVLALTIGQVMTDSGIDALDIAMKQHPKTRLLINGEVSHRFLQREKQVANKHNIPYTIISNTDVDTKIGAVLTYEYAVNIEHIFIEDLTEEHQNEDADEPETHSFFDRIREWFK